MSQNPRKQAGGPKVEEGFPLWRNQSASRRNRLLEFKAGKMFVRENMVHPDTRKGLVYIYQDDEGVVHFCWMDRTRGVVEEDLITMPADCSYKRIEKCTTGRVYMLKMRSSSKTLFFWMQEPSTANDLHICNRVNSLLNFPPPRMLFPEQVFTNELQFILNQLNSEQLHALYNGDDIVWVDTRNQPAEVEERSGPPPSPPLPPDPFVNLGEVINQESVKTISKNPALMGRLEGKLPSIEGDQKNNLDDTVKSSPFKHAIEDFSLALKQGTSGQLLRELNVNSAAVAAADKGDVDSFIKALQGGSMAIPQKKGGSPPGPGNSGSPGTKPKDPSQASNRKDSEGSRKESTQQDEPKSNFKQTNGESRKRTYDTMSRGAIQVNSAQQTEPIRITSLVQSLGPEMKITRKFAPPKFFSTSDDDSSLEKSQNTDPVQIEEYVSSTGYNSNYEQRASGSSITKPSGPIQINIQQTRKEVSPTKLKDGLESVELSIPDGVIRVGNETNMIRNDLRTESKITTNKRPDILAEINETKLSSNKREERIVLTNDYQRETSGTSKKRAYVDIDETKEQAKDAGMKRIKFEDKHLETKPKETSIEEVQNDSSDGNDGGIIKVEGEQQTEPVRIKSVPSTGAETKITTRRASTRGQRTDGSMERSQNTDPVRIEEKQKRQSKPKDPKPPGQE